MEEIKIKSVSWDTSVTEMIEVWQSDAWNARKCVEFYLTPKSDEDNWVKIKIYYQKKSKSWEWETPEELSLKRLKINEVAIQDLSRDVTKKIFDYLEYLYSLRESWVPKWNNKVLLIDEAEELISLDKNRKQIIDQLISQNYWEDVWNELISIDPNLATKLAYSRIVKERKDALDLFASSLKDKGDSENFWQDFFEKNDRIFGYGLDYRFMHILDTQTNVWSANSTDKKWDWELDYLGRIGAFTVLVEIKTPNMPLLSWSWDRTVNWKVSSKLVDAVTQWLWYKNDRISTKKEYLGGSKYERHQADPKVIIICWSLDGLEWKDERETDQKIKTFELFRRNLRNIDIITFDELYERANHIVWCTNKLKEDKEASDLPF